MKIIQGDLIKLAKAGEFDAIVHGCNCFCTMGSGIAKAIKENYPEAYEADLKTKAGDRNKLGTYSFASYDKNSLVVFNAYTQYYYGRGKDLFDYEAFESVMRKFLAIDYHFQDEHGGGLRWGFPLIGCGLAGGDKNRILDMIEDIMKDSDVTVVEFKE